MRWEQWVRWCWMVGAALGIFGLGCSPMMQPQRAPQRPLDPPDASWVRSDALGLLPATTEMAVLVRAPRAIADHLSWARVLSRHPNARRAAGAWTEAWLGSDIVGPDPLSSAGIDTTQAVGLAVIGRSVPIYCAFFELGDARKFRASMARFAAIRGEPLRIRTMGLGTAFSPAAHAHWIALERGRLGFVLWSDASESLVLDAAEELARPDAKADADPLLLASLRLQRGSHLVAWMRSPSLLQRWIGIWDRTADPIFGSIEEVGFGMSLQENQIDVRMTVAMRPDSLLSRALDVPAHPSDLHGVRDPGLAVLSLAMRRELMPDLMSAALGLTGDPRQARRQLRTRLGMDLDRDLVPYLAGDVAFAARTSLEHGRPHRRGTFAVRLRSNEAGTRLVDIAATRGRTWAVDARGFAVRDQFVFSDDEQLVRLLERGRSVSVPTASPPLSAEGKVDALLAHQKLMGALTVEMPAFYDLVLSDGDTRPRAWLREALSQLGLVALRADRAESDVSLEGGLFLRATSLAEWLDAAATLYERDQVLPPEGLHQPPGDVGDDAVDAHVGK